MFKLIAWKAKKQPSETILSKLEAHKQAMTLKTQGFQIRIVRIA